VAKKRVLGCSFPVFIIVAIILFGLLLISALGGPIGSKLLGLAGIHFQLPSWLAVEKPAPELAAETLIHIGSFAVTNTMITAWISILILVIFAALVTRKLKLVPSRLQSILEYAVTTLLNLCENIAGPKYGRQVFPIVATIFLFVFVNAWTSLIPGYGSIMVTIHGTAVPLLRGANTDINLPLALAIVAFITVEFFGFKAMGLRYLGKFIQLGKIGQSFKKLFKGNFKGAMGDLAFGIIDFFVGILELISEFIRLVSFTFRLFGNMTAGEILLLSISFLVPWVLSIAIYGLEMLVGFVQALAFSMLTLIFTSIAVAGHETEEESAQEEKT